MKDGSAIVGDIVEVTVDRLSYGGDAIARHQGLAVFVPFAAPGDRLRVRITERKKNYARASIVEILTPSPSRRDPPCSYFGVCGGCQLQHITYQSQLDSKLGFVRDALERIGGIDWPHQIEIRNSVEFGYRARAQVKVDLRAGRIGFNRASSSDVCDVKACPILVPDLENSFRSIASALDQIDKSTLLKRLHVDIAAGENQISFNPALGNLPGGTLTRHARGTLYRFDPSTFFQVNPGMLESLIDEAVGDSAGDEAIDLYAGVGLFTIQLAKRFRLVSGVESDPEAAKFARDNLRANHVTNVEFHQIDVATWLNRRNRSNSRRVGLLLLDPPRSGAADVLADIIDASPSRIRYVACDPTTLARDLRALLNAGYVLSRVTAIDLFPQTYHVETVATLEKE